MTTKYVFKDGPLILRNADKADPQKIGEAVEKIGDAAEGRVEPQAVVDAARNPRNVLHKHFEWDDKKAGEAFRLSQARSLISSLRVETKDQDEPTRAFLSVADEGGVSYRTIEEVQSSRTLQLAVLRQADKDLEAIEKRYRELTDICALVRQARGKVAEKIQQASV